MLTRLFDLLSGFLYRVVNCLASILNWAGLRLSEILDRLVDFLASFFQRAFLLLATG